MPPPAWSDHVWWLLEVGQVKWYLIKICRWPTLSVSHARTRKRASPVSPLKAAVGVRKRGGFKGRRGGEKRALQSAWRARGGKKNRTLPLFIKLRQIQLACGLPSNPINLLSCESTQQLLPISHFSWLLIRSAGDIPWGSLQLHHRRYSCSKPRRPAWSASSSFSLNLFNFPPFLLPASPPPSTCHLHPVFPFLPSPLHAHPTPPHVATWWQQKQPGQ